MSEVRNEVTMTEVYMVCDDCCDGHMIFRNVIKQKKPRFLHECDNCGRKGIYDVIYPYIIDENGRTKHYSE